MKIGIIGYGNMGSMIANNILKLDLLLEDEKLIISNRNIEKLSHLKEEYFKIIPSKLELTKDNLKIAKECEKIIIAVETPQFKKIIEEINPYITNKTHIIYTCAGLNFNHIETFYNGKLTLIIPTLASTVTDTYSIKSFQRRKGISLIKHNKKVESNEQIFIEDLFNEFSYVKKISETETKKEYEIKEHELNKKTKSNNELEISTILTSCGPAFVAIIIQKLAEIASNKSNLTYHECEKMISKTVLGTIQLKERNNLTNQEIINRVATKKGITEEGINYLDDKFSEIGAELINHLLKRYDDVKKDMDKEYSINYS